MVDAPLGHLQSEQINEFYTVTDEMTKILALKGPEIRLDESLGPELKYALKALFEARTAKDAENAEFVSGVLRSKRLNQALISLQPILATALRPDFKEGRTAYNRLVQHINQVRSDINTAILLELGIVYDFSDSKKNVEGGDDDQDDDQDDDDEGDNQPENASSEGAGDKSSRSGTWLRRFLDRRDRNHTGERHDPEHNQLIEPMSQRSSAEIDDDTKTSEEE